MYKHCTTEESARRQRQLEQCLLALMGDKQFQQITVGDICDLAGVSRKSFYRYFDNKEDCLNALLDHAIMDGSTFYFPVSDSSDLALDFCCRIFEYWQKQASLLDALEHNGQSLQLMQRIVRYILEEEPDYSRYMGISSQDLMEHVVYTVGGIMGLILTWHHERYPKSAAQMGELLYRLIRRQHM